MAGLLGDAPVNEKGKKMKKKKRQRPKDGGSGGMMVGLMTEEDVLLGLVEEMSASIKGVRVVCVSSMCGRLGLDCLSKTDFV